MSKDPESIEDAGRKAVRDAAVAESEVACLLHEKVTVLHLAADGCPLCRKPDPEKIIEAVHRLATASAPMPQVLNAVRAMEPFTAQLRAGKGITAMGHTVDDVLQLGKAQQQLEAWLNGAA